MAVFFRIELSGFGIWTGTVELNLLFLELAFSEKSPLREMNAEEATLRLVGGQIKLIFEIWLERTLKVLPPPTERTADALSMNERSSLASLRC